MREFIKFKGNVWKWVSFNNETEFSLAKAAIKGNLKQVNRLIAQGAVLSYVDAKPIIWYVAQANHDNPQIIKALVEKLKNGDSYINKLTFQNCNPLLVALSCGNLKIAEQLIKEGDRLEFISDRILETAGLTNIKDFLEKRSESTTDVELKKKLASIKEFSKKCLAVNSQDTDLGSRSNLDPAGDAQRQLGVKIDARGAKLQNLVDKISKLTDNITNPTEQRTIEQSTIIYNEIEFYAKQLVTQIICSPRTIGMYGMLLDKVGASKRHETIKEQTNLPKVLLEMVNEYDNESYKHNYQDFVKTYKWQKLYEIFKPNFNSYLMFAFSCVIIFLAILDSILYLDNYLLSPSINPRNHPILLRNTLNMGIEAVAAVPAVIASAPSLVISSIAAVPAIIAATPSLVISSIAAVPTVIAAASSLVISSIAAVPDAVVAALAIVANAGVNLFYAIANENNMNILVFFICIELGGGGYLGYYIINNFDKIDDFCDKLINYVSGIDDFCDKLINYVSGIDNVKIKSIYKHQGNDRIYTETNAKETAQTTEIAKAVESKDKAEESKWGDRVAGKSDKQQIASSSSSSLPRTYADKVLSSSAARMDEYSMRN